MNYFINCFAFILFLSHGYSLGLYEIVMKRYEVEEMAKDLGEIHFFGLDINEKGMRVFKANLTVARDFVQDDWECEVLSSEKKNNVWKRGSFNYEREDCCTMVKNEGLVLGKMFEDFGLPKRCPIQAGFYETRKGIYMDSTHLPPIIPGKDWRFDWKVYYGKTQKVALKIAIDIEIDRSKKNILG